MGHENISGNVKISISRSGGKAGTFEIITESTENDGYYLWSINGSASVNCVLKIEPLTDTSKATSQGLFTLYGPTPTVSSIMTSSITTTSAASRRECPFSKEIVRLLPVAYAGAPLPIQPSAIGHTSDGTGTGTFTSTITG